MDLIERFGHKPLAMVGVAWRAWAALVGPGVRVCGNLESVALMQLFAVFVGDYEESTCYGVFFVTDKADSFLADLQGGL